MSFEEPQGGRWYTNRAVLAAAAVAAIAVVFFFFVGGGGRTKVRPTGTGSTAERPREDELTTAREALAKETDYATCDSALQQINSYLAQHPEQRPPALSSEEAERLRS